MKTDQILSPVDYLAIPWRDGGLTRAGLDCRGLAWLFLSEQGLVGADPIVPGSADGQTCEQHLTPFRVSFGWSAAGHAEVARVLRQQLEPNDLVFFRDRRTGRVNHVAIYLGGDRYLHTVRGCSSRIDHTPRLIMRLGWQPAGYIRAQDAEALAAALRDPALGSWEFVVLAIISIALSAASAFLQSRPKMGQFRNTTGRYGFDQLFTQTSTTLPLPDILGAVTVAGNSPYQSLIDKTQEVTDQTQQRINKVVVVASGPVQAFSHNGNGIKVNGIPYDATYWHASGFALNPTQDKANAVDGTISGESNRPSVTSYDATPAISVPVDVRAQYDRNFPIYGFAGCGYLVFRLIDSAKFPNFNLTCTVRGRKFRSFDENGFTETTATAESLSGADGSKVRFKLVGDDIKSVTSLSVNGDAYSEVSSDQQAGRVYRLNAQKGYVEFLTAPPAAATITITYIYYPRTWSQNPVVHAVYLLTEPIRGKGLPASKIDWARAVEARDYCDEQIAYENPSGTYIGPRFTSNYALDYRKPIQDHIRAVLDSFYGYLFLSNGKLVIKPRRADTSVMSFDTSNILRDSFSTELVDRSTLANQIRVFYHSLDTLNAETEVVVDDPVEQAAQESLIGNAGVRSETYRMLAVDSQQQAERLGKMLLGENRNVRWVGEFTTSIRGLALEPGDVIDLTHPSQPSWSQKLARIEEITLDEQDRHIIRWSEYSAAPYLEALAS